MRYLPATLLCLLPVAFLVGDATSHTTGPLVTKQTKPALSDGAPPGADWLGLPRRRPRRAAGPHRRRDDPPRMLPVAISPDGKHALAGNNNGALYLWNLASGRIVPWSCTKPGTYWAPPGYVACISFTPDGKRFVSGSEGLLTLADAFTGRLLREFRAEVRPQPRPDHKGDKPTVNAVAVSASGKQALAGSADGTLRLWDLDSGKLVRTFDYLPQRVHCVALSGDGRWALSDWCKESGPNREYTCALWDVGSGKVVRHLKSHTDMIRAVAFTADTRRVVTGSDNGTIQVWDRASGKLHQTLWPRANDEIKSLAVLPSGRFVLVGGGSKGLALWELTSGKEVVSFEDNSSSIDAMSVSADGRRALTLSGSHVILWDLTTGEEIRTLSGPPHSCPGIGAVAFSPDGNIAAAGSCRDDYRWELYYNRARLAGVKVPSTRGIVTLWDVRTGRVLRTLRGHHGMVDALVFLPDGKCLLSFSFDRALRLWQVDTGNTVRVFKDVQFPTIAVGSSPVISPNGKFVLSRGYGCVVCDAETGKVLRTLVGENSTVDSVAFTADGKRALVSCDSNYVLFDVATGKRLRVTKQTSPGITWEKLTPDGKRALSAHKDIQLWDVETGKLLRILGRSRANPNLVWGAVAVSLDGKRALAANNQGGIGLWDLRTGKYVREFLVKGVRDPIFSLAFSPDGRFAISGGAGGVVKVWNVGTGKQVHNLINDNDW